jgi:putative ABC transport system permease protein
MSLSRMAWRNLWRNPRRSIVTVAAMTLALWVMILYSGLVQGYWRGMERGVLDMEVGDLQVFAPGYLDSPSLYTNISDPATVLRRLDQLGYPASPRLLGGGLAAAGEQSAGVSLRGVDVRRDARVCRISTAVGEGAWLDPRDPKGVVIGRRLAKALGVRAGQELVVVTQGADGSLANDLYRIRGVLKTVADGTDRTAVFMNEAAFRELLVLPRGTHQIIVRRPEAVPLEVAAARVRSVAGQLDVRTWQQLLPTVASMLESSRSVVFVAFATIYLAVSILVLNAMLMAVFERIRELGVLKALGVGPLRVLALILLESGIQTGIAVVVALLASLPGIYYLARFGVDVGKLGGVSMLGHAMPPIWYGVYTAETLTAPIAMLVAMVLIGVLYPAFKAAWIRPVAAMRHT